MSRPFGSATASSHRAPASLGAAVCSGALATVTMDSAMVAAGLIGGEAFSSDRLGPEIIGRWAAGLLHGRWRGEDISREPPVRGELALGLATHYATGIALTCAFVLVSGRTRHPLAAGVGYGVATAIFPLFVMFPSMGYGWCGTHSGEAGPMVRMMLVGHVAFGAGIGFWTRRLGS